MKVSFSGGKGIEAALKELNISTARVRGIATRALDKAAVPIRDKWAGGVDEQSGDLKKSIAIGSRALTKANRKFKRNAGSDIVERYIGIDAKGNDRLPIYAYIEEFGSDKEPANPAGRAAWEGEKMKAFDLIASELTAEIDKVAKAAARKGGGKP